MSDRITMLDLARSKGHDRTVGLIEESVKFLPEFDLFSVRQVVGTSYDTLTRTALPSAGFTAVGAGVTPSKSTFKKSRVECYLMQARIELARSIVDASEEGPEWWQGVEATGAAISALRATASQIYYGTTANAFGFAGLKAANPFGGALTTSAGGTSPGTASSAFFVKFGVQDVQMIAGRNSTIEMSDFMVESIEDADGKKHPGYVSHLIAWLGLQIGNVNCTSRICNLTADSGKGLTDALIATHLAKIPIGYRPDVILVSRRSNSQLQTSRTPTLFTGPSARIASNIEAIGPRPTESQGIPIIESDSIVDTDAIES
jgi:hypothetical protein